METLKPAFHNEFAQASEEIEAEFNRHFRGEANEDRFFEGYQFAGEFEQLLNELKHRGAEVPDIRKTLLFHRLIGSGIYKKDAEQSTPVVDVNGLLERYIRTETLTEQQRAGREILAPYRAELSALRWQAEPSEVSSDQLINEFQYDGMLASHLTRNIGAVLDDGALRPTLQRNDSDSSKNVLLASNAVHVSFQEPYAASTDAHSIPFFAKESGGYQQYLQGAFITHPGILASHYAVSYDLKKYHEHDVAASDVAVLNQESRATKPGEPLVSTALSVEDFILVVPGNVRVDPATGDVVQSGEPGISSRDYIQGKLRALRSAGKPVPKSVCFTAANNAVAGLQEFRKQNDVPVRPAVDTLQSTLALFDQVGKLVSAKVDRPQSGAYVSIRSSYAERRENSTRDTLLEFYYLTPGIHSSWLHESQVRLQE